MREVFETEQSGLKMRRWRVISTSTIVASAAVAIFLQTTLPVSPAVDGYQGRDEVCVWRGRGGGEHVVLLTGFT